VSPPPFPNVEKLLVADLQVLAGAETIADGARWDADGVTPEDLQDHVPFVRVRRVGGPSDNVNDYPFAIVDVYAATYSAAIDIAEEIRAHLVAGHIRNAHGQIDRTICTSAHTELEASDPALRLISTTYRATCRRLSPAL
jgi:hypothetical protein